MKFTALHIFLLLLVAAFLALFLVRRRWAWNYARVTVLLLATCVTLTPFAWLICAVFKDPSVLNTYTFFPPFSEWSTRTLNMKNFTELLADKPTLQGTVSFWRHVLNSLFLASAGTFISLFCSSLGGYALAKYRFKGKAAIQIFMLASMTVPGVVTLAPNYETIYRLGWMDSYLAFLVPGAVSVFGIFLFRQACIGIPTDIIEAGRIDGCSEFRIYHQLVMPLVRPMIGAFCLVTFIGWWNAFLGPNIFLQTQSKLPLTVVLNQYIGQYSQQYGVFLAGTLLAIIPPAVLFFSLQKEFIAGLTSGAVKQ